MVSTSTFAVLAEPNRRRILDLLRGRPRCVGELVAALGISQPGTSKHLRVLLDSHLVDVRQEAQRRVYTVRSGPLEEIAAWLEPYRAQWTERLDQLERVLDQPDPEQETKR